MGDIVFLVHTNIDPQHAQSVRNFLYILANSLQVGGDNIRVSLALYGDTPTTEFLLSAYPRKGDVLKHIRGLQFKPGGNRMGQSLQFILEHHFREGAGSRASQGVPQVALVMSTGVAEDHFREPAEALKREGILLYAIGVKDAAQAELREIASSPKDNFTFFVPNFSGLPGLAQKLRPELCTTLAKVVQHTEQGSPGNFFFLIWTLKNSKLCLSHTPLLCSCLYVCKFNSEVTNSRIKMYLFPQPLATTLTSRGPVAVPYTEPV